MWYVYMLRCADGSLYTGSTNRLKRRLLAHFAGTASEYTRSRLPVYLVRLESCTCKSEALSREWAVKQLSKSDKERLVRSTGTRQDSLNSQPDPIQ